MSRIADTKARTIALLQRARAVDALVESELSESPAAKKILAKAGKKRAGPKQKQYQLAYEAALEASEPVGRAKQLMAESHALCWEVVCINDGLVHHEARKFHWVDQDDAKQVARLGALQAAWRFDPERGVTFYTFARWWVHAELSRKFPLSDLAAGTQEFLRNIHKLEQMGITDDEEIAEWFEVSLEQIRKYRALEHSQQQLSLDTPIGEDGQALLELLPADEPEDATDIFEWGKVARLLEDLPPRPAEVLKRRYGLEGDGPQSLGEIAESDGVSRERIRQLQEQGIEWIRDRIARPNGVTEKWARKGQLPQDLVSPPGPRLTPRAIAELVAQKPEGTTCRALSRQTGMSYESVIRVVNAAKTIGAVHTRGEGGHRKLFAGPGPVEVPPQGVITLSDRIVNLATGDIRTTTGGKPAVALPPREAAVLSYLAARLESWVSLEELCSRPLGSVRPNTIRNAICVIRRRVERDPHAPKHVQHQPRLGYRLANAKMLGSEPSQGS